MTDDEFRGARVFGDLKGAMDEAGQKVAPAEGPEWDYARGQEAIRICGGSASGDAIAETAARLAREGWKPKVFFYVVAAFETRTALSEAMERADNWSLVSADTALPCLESGYRPPFEKPLPVSRRWVWDMGQHCCALTLIGWEEMSERLKGRERGIPALVACNPETGEAAIWPIPLQPGTLRRPAE